MSKVLQNEQSKKITHISLYRNHKDDNEDHIKTKYEVQSKCDNVGVFLLNGNLVQLKEFVETPEGLVVRCVDAYVNYPQQMQYCKPLEVQSRDGMLRELKFILPTSHYGQCE